jgi:hypothetical protein
MNEAMLVFLVWAGLVLVVPGAMWVVVRLRRNRSGR